MSLRSEESLLIKEKDRLEAKLAKLQKSNPKAKLPEKEKIRFDEITTLLKKKIISVTMTQSLVNHIDELVKEILVEEGNSQSLTDGLIAAVDMLNSNTDIGKQNREKVLAEYSEKNIDTLKEYLYD